jgi:hypothetical protein
VGTKAELTRWCNQRHLPLTFCTGQCLLWRLVLPLFTPDLAKGPKGLRARGCGGRSKPHLTCPTTMGHGKMLACCNPASLSLNTGFVFLLVQPTGARPWGGEAVQRVHAAQL